MSDKAYVLDASALLAALNEEPGGDRVQDLLPHAPIGAVNLSEVVAKLQERGVPDAVIDDVLADLDLKVIPFTSAQAVKAGKLRVKTKSAGLSLGDRACLALCAELGAVAVTTDRSWTKLKIGVSVEAVR